MLLMDLTVEQLVAVLFFTIFLSIVISNIFIGMMKFSIEIGSNIGDGLAKLIKKYMVKKRASRPYLGDSNG